MAEPTPPKKKPPPQAVITFRAPPSTKADAQQMAAWQGYEQYTAWVRDVILAELQTPKHRPVPGKPADE